MKFNSKIYETHEINNFKELIDYSCEHYANNVSYKFKKNLGKSNETVIEKTYQEIKKEIEGFSTSLLYRERRGKVKPPRGICQGLRMNEEIISKR